MMFAAGVLSSVATAVGAPGVASTITGAATSGLVAALPSAGTVAGVIGGALSVGSALAISRASETAAAGAISSSNINALGIFARGEADALAAITEGKTAALQNELEALDAETEIDIEEVQGLERRNSLRRALIQTVGERDVATAAAGVDLSFGTPSIARQEANEDTERALTIDTATEKFRVARLRERADVYRLASRQAKQGGLAKAAAYRADAKYQAAALRSEGFQTAQALRSEGSIRAAGLIGNAATDILRRG